MSNLISTEEYEAMDPMAQLALDLAKDPSVTLEPITPESRARTLNVFQNLGICDEQGNCLIPE